MAELSPAAKAVMYALYEGWHVATPGQCLAAALRAAADQVAPSDAMEPRNYLPVAIECQRIRAELLAIAAELDDTNSTSEGDFDACWAGSISVIRQIINWRFYDPD
jgi:hypothetical protein